MVESELKLSEIKKHLKDNYQNIKNLSEEISKINNQNGELLSILNKKQDFIDNQKIKIHDQLQTDRYFKEHQEYSKNIIKEGNDILTPEYGDVIVFHLVAEVDGNALESTRTKDSKPITKFVTNEDLIPGLLKCILGMKLGERCKVKVPPSMRGSHTFGLNSIPSDATLEYDVELLAINKSTQEQYSVPKK